MKDGEGPSEQQVIRGLVQMAGLSSRSQADLGAVMRKAGIPARLEVIVTILDRLRAAGLVEGVIPLSDGGVILTVTPKAMQLYRRP